MKANEKVWSSVYGVDGPVYSISGELTNTNPSSAQYKENIADINLDPERILGLEPKSFSWKDSGIEDFGYIAEDVKEVVPELYIDDGYTVGYAEQKLIFYVVEILKEQQKTFEEQQDTIDVLQQETEDLKQEIAELKE